MGISLLSLYWTIYCILFPVIIQLSLVSVLFLLHIHQSPCLMLSSSHLLMVLFLCITSYIPYVSFHISAGNTLKLEHTELLRSGCIFKYILWKENILVHISQNFVAPIKKGSICLNNVFLLNWCQVISWLHEVNDDPHVLGTVCYDIEALSSWLPFGRWHFRGISLKNVGSCW